MEVDRHVQSTFSGDKLKVPKTKQARFQAQEKKKRKNKFKKSSGKSRKKNKKARQLKIDQSRLTDEGKGWWGEPRRHREAALKGLKGRESGRQTSGPQVRSARDREKEQRDILEGYRDAKAYIEAGDNPEEMNTKPDETPTSKAYKRGWNKAVREARREAEREETIKILEDGDRQDRHFIEDQDEWEERFKVIAENQVHVNIKEWEGFKPNPDLDDEGVAARLWQKGDRVWLEVDPGLWSDWTDEQKTDLLKHEAIHLRYEDHGSGFKDLADRLDAPRTTNQLLGKPAKLQVKRNGEYYYEDYKEFSSPEEATIWAKTHRDELPDDVVKARVEY